MPRPGAADTGRLRAGHDGDIWAEEFALIAATDEVEHRVTELVRRAVGEG